MPLQIPLQIHGHLAVAAFHTNGNTLMPETAVPTYPFTLPPLRFPYDALEPYMDALTLERHHAQHHAAYISALNTLIADQPQLHGISIEDLLRRLHMVPMTIREKVTFHAGGHANHQFLWKILNPRGNTQPKGVLKVSMERDFGSIAHFKKQFNEAAITLWGSGWVFLVVDPQRGGRLALHIAKNNESVLPLGMPGLLICDVWEHAYHLKYQNRPADYMDAYWQLIDWDVVTKRLEGIHAGKKQL